MNKCVKHVTRYCDYENLSDVVNRSCVSDINIFTYCTVLNLRKFVLLFLLFLKIYCIISLIKKWNFIYQSVTCGQFDGDEIVMCVCCSKEICDKDGAGGFIMCPLCDKNCPYWRLLSNCIYSRLTYVFENYATALFAAFMAVWCQYILQILLFVALLHF